MELNGKESREIEFVSTVIVQPLHQPWFSPLDLFYVNEK